MYGHFFSIKSLFVRHMLFVYVEPHLGLKFLHSPVANVKNRIKLPLDVIWGVIYPIEDVSFPGILRRRLVSFDNGIGRQLVQINRQDIYAKTISDSIFA